MILLKLAIIFLIYYQLLINCKEIELSFNSDNNNIDNINTTSLQINSYDNFQLYIVYFAFIPQTSVNYDRRIKAHLSDLVSTGLCNSNVHIVIVITAFTNSLKDMDKMDIAVGIARNACSTAIIKSYYENT